MIKHLSRSMISAERSSLPEALKHKFKIGLCDNTYVTKPRYVRGILRTRVMTASSILKGRNVKMKRKESRQWKNP